VHVECVFKEGLCLCNDKAPNITNHQCAFFCNDQGISLYNLIGVPGTASCFELKHCNNQTCICEGDNNDCHCCTSIPKGQLKCSGCNDDDDYDDNYDNEHERYDQHVEEQNNGQQNYCCKDILNGTLSQPLPQPPPTPAPQPELPALNCDTCIDPCLIGSCPIQCFNSCCSICIESPDSCDECITGCNPFYCQSFHAECFLNCLIPPTPTPSPLPLNNSSTLDEATLLILEKEITSLANTHFIQEHALFVILPLMILLHF